MGFKNCIYFSNWSVYERGHFPIDIPMDKVTHIFYAFLLIDKSSGALRFSDTWCDLELPMKSPKNPNNTVKGNLQQLFEMKQMNKNLKVCMSIGGWGTDVLFSEVMLNSTKRANFVASCMKFLLEYGFDGIDVDWEYPKNASESKAMVELLASLRLELNKIEPSLSLSIASPAGQDQLRILDLKKLDQYLSFWNIMCYDFCGEGWSSKTGYHSNLYLNNGDNDLNGHDVIKYYLKHGIPSEKIIFGIPLYGRKFRGVRSQAVHERFKKSSDVDIIDYYKILEYPGTTRYDAKKGCCSKYNPVTMEFIVFDDPNTIKLKSQFIQEKGLGGAMWWDSAGDAKSTERSLVSHYVENIGGEPYLEKTPNHTTIYKKSKYLHDIM